MSPTQGAAFIAGLLGGLSDKVRLPIVELGQDHSSNATVNGGGQSGRSLAVHNAVPGHTFAAGKMFSLEHAGVYYLHTVTSTVTADSNGQVTLPILPMLRVIPAVDDVLHFDVPAIEGFIDGQAQQWTVELAQTIGLSFSVTETT